MDFSIFFSCAYLLFDCTCHRQKLHIYDQSILSWMRMSRSAHMWISQTWAELPFFFVQRCFVVSAAKSDCWTGLSSSILIVFNINQFSLPVRTFLHVQLSHTVSFSYHYVFIRFHNLASTIILLLSWSFLSLFRSFFQEDISHAIVITEIVRRNFFRSCLYETHTDRHYTSAEEARERTWRSRRCAQVCVPFGDMSSR